MFSFLGNFFFFSNKYKKFHILTDRFSINCKKFFRAGIKKNLIFFPEKTIFFSLSLAFTCSMLTIRNTRTRCEICSKLKYVHAISQQGKVAYQTTTLGWVWSVKLRFQSDSRDFYLSTSLRKNQQISQVFLCEFSH